MPDIILTNQDQESLEKQLNNYLSKMKNIFFLFLLVFQLSSCQDKIKSDKKDNNCPENGFCVENRQLRYNQKLISIGMPVEKFIAIFGKQDRTAIDSIGGKPDGKGWSWKDGGEAYINDEGKIVYFNINRNAENEFFKTIDDAVKKFGKFEKEEITKNPLRIHTFYVWDKLGMNVSVRSGKVSQINIYPLHVSKTMKLEFGEERLLKSADGSTIIKERVDESERKDHKIIFNRHPKQEYKGKFSYDGNTIDFSKIGDQGWNKMVSGLKITGDDYSKGGDSKDWFRELRETPELRVTFNRYSNENAYDELSVKKLGKIDGVQSIEIWNFDDSE